MNEQKLMQQHFKNIHHKTFEAFLKELKDNEIELDKIDLMACDSESDLDNIKQYLKDEYGVILKRHYDNKEKILIEVDKEIVDNVKMQKQAFESLLEQNRTFQGNALEIQKELKAYSLHTEKVAISTLIAVSQRMNVINIGEMGTGKTHSTKGLLDVMGIPYSEIKGHITPKRFYELLKMYNNTIILIDESANMLTEMEIRNLLLSALNREKVYWLDDWFDCDSTIIFNSNYLQDNPVMRAVMDRCITNHIKLKSDELKEKLRDSRNYQPNFKIMEEAKNNLFRNLKLSEAQINAVYEILEIMEIKSMRDKWRMLNIAEASVKLTNSLDLLQYFVQIDRIAFILANPELKKEDKVKLLAKETGKSIRTAQRMVKKQ